MIKVNTKLDTMPQIERKKLERQNKKDFKRNSAVDPTYRILSVRQWIAELFAAKQIDK